MQSSDQMQFASGDGEMSKLTREKDWTATALGPPSSWPKSLRTALSIVLHSKFPMFLWWGPELICFYNDAYRPSLGNDGKHPHILGMPAKQAWPEIWDIIKPLIDSVTEKKEAVWFEDMLVPIYRNGKIEDVYWTFSYSPLIDDTGTIEGILVTCSETTANVLMKKQLEESDRKLRLIIAQAPVSIVIFRGKDHIAEMANSKALFLLARTEEQVLNKSILDAMPELQSQGIKELLDEVYSTGKPFSAVERPIQINRNGKLETAYINFTYDPLFDEHGNIDGIIAVGSEVTEQMLAHKKIELSEEKLNIVIDASRLGTWEWDLVNNRMAYSKLYLDFFGYDEKTVLTHDHFLGLLHPADLPLRDQAMKEAMQTGYLQYQSRIILRNGITRWFEARGRVFFDAAHTPQKLVGTIRDITDEKNYHNSLEQSEQKLRNFIMQSPIPKAILKGKDHVVEMANEALLNNIWRKKAADVIGKKLMNIFPELKQQKHAALLDNVYNTGVKHTETDSPMLLSGDDGLRSFYIDFEYAPMLEADSSISGIKITAIDVTEKVEARLKIEKSELKFRLLADSMPQHIWTADAAGNFNYFNRSVFDFSGLSQDQMDESGWLEIVHPDDREESIRVWTEAVATGADFLFEHRFRKNTGEYRWQLSRAVPQKDVSGRIQMWVGTSTDIQDIKELENQKDLFISMASHELKTPITSIKGYIQLLQTMHADGEDEFLKNALNIIDKQVVILTKLVSDLLDLSKMKSDNIVFNLETFSIKDLVEEIVTQISHINPGHTIDADAADIMINADRNRIGQVLINFLTNAVKYSTDATKIEVHALRQDNDVLVTVKDSGIGIKKHDQEKIFERFYRVEGKNEKKFPGFGIGLFIAADIVHKHNGTIGVHSVEGKGSEFWFTLPLS